MALNYQILVLGDGVTSGIHTLTKEATLLKFLAQLGSMQNADLENAYLIRDKKKIKSGFYELFTKGDISQDIVLEPNDILFIPDNFEKRINIVGAVKKPATIPYREGLTILDIILSVGGFTEFAKENEVVIIRKGGNEKRAQRSIRVKDLMKGDFAENITILPGDFIVVKESFF
jgi:polysaccharide export outer membrane protein